ncbi:MAG: RagB/SusD family nutrient uptake outer membrane protein [Bacteroidales bacterium]|nr:RagB/SusD family nutrient uptake outer membrane protein [Bacteroidales bacterium]
MKKNYFLLGISILFFGCSDILEETPYTFLSPENLSNSQEGVEMMITGMYSNFYTTYMMKKTFMEWVSYDNDWTNGETWAMAGPGSGNPTTHWAYNTASDLFNVFYTLINNANMAIGTIKDSDIDEILKNQYLGEAYTMRAWSYFYLVQLYGAVPLRLSINTPESMARSPITDVYGQIVQDLSLSEQLLSLKSDNVVEYGHITRGAAQGILARVYATMGSGSLNGKSMEVNTHAYYDGNIDEVVKTSITVTKNMVTGYDFDPVVSYDSAKAVALRLINSEEYFLEDWASMWFPANHGGDEFIWAVTSSESNIDYRTEHLSVYFSTPGLQGKGWIHYAPDLYYLYDKEDERAKYGITHVYSRSEEKEKISYFPIEDSTIYIDKYGRENVVPGYTEECYLMKYYLGDMQNPDVILYEDDEVTYNPIQDFPLVRYAEAYLIYAEAENELNGATTDVFDKLDILLSKRNAPLVNRTMDQDQLRSFIFEQRLLEFVGETLRKTDLLRWGVYLEIQNNIQYRDQKWGRTVNKIRENKNLLYPVPTNEVVSNLLFGVNNPGW